jgi:hypothetical protein
MFHIKGFYFNYILTIQIDLLIFIYNNMIILNFFDFILENYKKIEVPFQFCQDFHYILNEIESPISLEILKI